MAGSRSCAALAQLPHQDRLHLPGTLTATNPVGGMMEVIQGELSGSRRPAVSDRLHLPGCLLRLFRVSGGSPTELRSGRAEERRSREGVGRVDEVGDMLAGWLMTRLPSTTPSGSAWDGLGRCPGSRFPIQIKRFGSSWFERPILGFVVRSVIAPAVDTTHASGGGGTWTRCSTGPS